MMDIIHIIIWSVSGLLITWAIFIAWVGLRDIPAYSKKRLAKLAATVTFSLGVFWVLLWVSAVIFNILQLTGGITWHLI